MPLWNAERKIGILDIISLALTLRILHRLGNRQDWVMTSGSDQCQSDFYLARERGLPGTMVEVG